MKKDIAYRLAKALTDDRGTWVPVPLDYFPDETAEDVWCVLNARRPYPVTMPTPAMWQAMDDFEKRPREEGR